MSPPPDDRGWFPVPHKEEPIRFADLPAPPRDQSAEEYYQTHWIPEVRMPQLIEDLEFIQDMHCDSDTPEDIQDYEFYSRWEALKYNHDNQFEDLYDRVRGSRNPSLANARMFELTMPERANGAPRRFLELWLDSDHPIEDSVFFSTNVRFSGAGAVGGHFCLVIRRVTHVRFLRATGVRDTEQYPRDKHGNVAVQGATYDSDALNYPGYVVQWGETNDFLTRGPDSLHTYFLNEDGCEFDYRDDFTGINNTDVTFAVPESYVNEDRKLTYVNRFTLDNEQSLKPQSPEAVLRAIRVGKRWSKGFTHRYYRKDGVGYCKEKAAFVAEMGEPGPSSAGEASAPAPKRHLSPSQLRGMWQRGRGAKAPRGPE